MPEIKLQRKGLKIASKNKSISLKPTKTQQNTPSKQKTKTPAPTQSTPSPKPTAPAPAPAQHLQNVPLQQNTRAPVQSAASARHASAQPASPIQPVQQNTGWNNWGTDLNDPFSGLGAGYGSQNPGFGTSPGRQSQITQPPKRQTPEERVQMINKIYSEILGREPDTRDINYYKYSTLNEDQIKKQLLTSAEHKDLIKKGREYDQLKNQTDQAKTQTKMLEGQIKDQIEEFKQLNILLKEKNSYIQQLREKTENLQPRSASVPQCIQHQPKGSSADTTSPPQQKDVDRSPDAITDIPPNPPTATFTDEIPQDKSKKGNRIKEVLTQFISQFF